MKSRYQVTLTKEYVDAFRMAAIANGTSQSLGALFDEQLRDLFGDDVEPIESHNPVKDIKAYASSLGLTTGDKIAAPFLPIQTTYEKPVERDEMGNLFRNLEDL